MRYHSSMYSINADTITRLIQQTPEKVIEMAEFEYQAKILAVCERIIEEQRHIILLTGPSASGKTTTAKMIQKMMTKRRKHVHRISLDNFYRPKDQLPRWGDGYVNYESIEGLDVPYFNELMLQLTTTGHADLPIFDFGCSVRSERTFPVTMEQDTYIIFEGIHALNPVLSEHFDSSNAIRIYVSVHSDFTDQYNQMVLSARQLRLLRRILRDNTHRGTSPVGTLEMWDYVIRGEREYIRPFRQYADYHINSTHSYEPFIYCETALQECRGFEHHEIYGEEIQTLIRQIQYFQPLDSHLIPPTSLLQEFI